MENTGNKELTYENAIKELETLVCGIENPERDITDIGGDVKRAMELVKWCKDWIKGSQEEIEKMLEQ